MKIKNTKIGLFIGSIINAFILLWLTLTLLNLPYVLPDEYVLVQASAVTKNLILGLEEKPDSSRFLFVNVAWDKDLIDKTEMFEEGGETFEFPIGNQPITDRGKLADFFGILAQNPNNHKMLLVDVFFKEYTDYDSIMTANLNKLPNTVVSYHRDAKDKPEYPDLKIKSLGLSDMETVYGVRLKFKIFLNDSIKTTPLIIYEKLKKKKFKKGKWYFDYLNGKPILRSFILDYQIRGYDYTNTNRYPKIHLGETLMNFYDPEKESYDIEAFKELTKDKIIIVGDFEANDIHDTIYGATPGPLILLDTFLALEAGDNVVTFGFLGYLIFSFALMSFITFRYRSVYASWLKKLMGMHKEGFFTAFTLYLVYFAIISIISFFAFNIHIGVMGLALYMTVLNVFKRIIYDSLPQNRLLVFFIIVAFVSAFIVLVFALFIKGYFIIEVISSASLAILGFFFLFLTRQRRKAFIKKQKELATEEH